jgi:hypothetical protein
MARRSKACEEVIWFYFRRDKAAIEEVSSLARSSGKGGALTAKIDDRRDTRLDDSTVAGVRKRSA